MTKLEQLEEEISNTRAGKNWYKEQILENREDPNRDEYQKEFWDTCRRLYNLQRRRRKLLRHNEEAGK